MYRLAALALLATSVAAKGGCPSTDITLDDWIGNAGGTHGACMTDDDCENAGECCVKYHVGYCGVPSDCNEYLQCRGAGNGTAFSASAMSDTPATNEEFQALLARADGGGAYYDGCPPTSETFQGYMAKGGACTTNLGCAADNAGSCCVRYTFPYCGVPSDCNSFLKCLSPSEEAAATSAAVEQGASPVDQSEAFAAALEKLHMMGAGNETDAGMGDMDPNVIVEALGACVNPESEHIDMQCIQGVLAELDPAVVGKLAKCAGGGSIAEMQACVEEQLTGGGGDMTTPPVADPTKPPSSATSASATVYIIGAIIAAAAYFSN